MAKDYIEREELVNYYRERYWFLRNASEKPLSGGKVLIDTEIQTGAIIAKEFLDKAINAPAADVVEVVHGEWIVAEDDYGICATEFTCSHCKVSLVTSELTDGQFLDMMKYCPNCGADMRGERKCEDG